MNPSSTRAVHHRVRKVIVALCLLAGCGSSSPPVRSAADEETPEQAERRQRYEAYQQIRSEEPEEPSELVRRQAFRTNDRCGQGPYRVPIEALGRRFGEEYSVYACAPRALGGDFRIDSEREWIRSESRSWGETQDNARCVANEAERAQASDAAAASPAGPEQASTRRQPPARRRAAPARAQTPPAPPALEVVDASGFDGCPQGLRRIDIAYRRGYISDTSAPLAAGTHVAVELWSALPNDLEGVIFVVEQRGVPETITQEAWAAYRAAYASWLERYRAFMAEEVAAGRSRYVDSSATSADPPPPARTETRPPRPSENAEWVPGYWHRGEGWAWMAGFWRVPEADVSAGLTVHAPTAPPPPRAEPEADGPKPASDAVWTSGYWQWDGRTYVWVQGAWRVPPAADQRWEAPTWRIEARGAVFVPGGWILGRRR